MITQDELDVFVNDLLDDEQKENNDEQRIDLRVS